MVTERNIIVINGLHVVDPPGISWKTEKVVEMLFRFRKCGMRLLVNTIEVLENTRICVAYHKRELVASHRQVKLLFLRMARFVKIQTDTATFRNIRLHMRVDNLKLVNSVIEGDGEEPLLHKLVNTIYNVVGLELCCFYSESGMKKSEKATSILKTRYISTIYKVRRR